MMNVHEEEDDDDAEEEEEKEGLKGHPMRGPELRNLNVFKSSIV